MPSIIATSITQQQHADGNKDNNNISFDEEQHMETPSVSQLHDLIVDVDEKKYQQESLQVMMICYSGSFEQVNGDDDAGSLSSPSTEAAANVETNHQAYAHYLAEIRAANAQNELSRANKQLDKCNAELADLKKKLEELTKENAKLNAGIQDAGKYVRDECQAAIDKHRREARKHMCQAEALRFELEAQNDIQAGVEANLVQQLKIVIDDEVNKKLDAEVKKRIQLLGEESKNGEKKGTSSSNNNNRTSAVIEITSKSNQQQQEKQVAAAATTATCPSTFLGAVSSAVSSVVSNIAKKFSSNNDQNNKKNRIIARRIFSFAHNEPVDPNQFACVEDRMHYELKCIRDAAKLHSAAANRKTLLHRIFQLAAEEVDIEVRHVIASGAYGNHVAYTGYKGSENFVRNECLFSGRSSVEESFFLKCSDRHLAAAIDPDTGKLNKDLFYFTFHGTRSVAAARAIQCEGYDPAKRACVAQNYGEFQGVSNSGTPTAFQTCLGYAQGLALVNLVFKPPVEEVDCENSIHEKLLPVPGSIKLHGPVIEYQGVLVVMNPMDRKDGVYQLPLGCIVNVDYLNQHFTAEAIKYKFDDETSASAQSIASNKRVCACAKHHEE